MRKFKYLLSLFTFLFALNSNAGFYEWEYFEPTAGCLIAGGVAYSSAKKGEEMKSGAVACAVAGIIIWGINEHYDKKYGDQFLGEEDYLEAKINKYNMLEHQSDNKKNNSSIHFKRVQQVLPPSIDKKGQGVGPRVKEKLILIDDSMRIGE